MKLIDMLIETLVTEGVYDPAIFKAIFIVGGAGSGKTFVRNKSTRGLGYKVVTSDDMLVSLMNKNNLSLKMPPEEDDERDALRTIAKDKTDDRLDMYLENRLGVIIEGTGHNYENIKNTQRRLAELGYDTFMIFVNVPMDVALDRNAKRDRSVPPDIVKEKWLNAQQNLGRYQSLFGRNNVSIIDNDDPSENVFERMWKNVMIFTKMKVKNHRAVEWIKQQLKKKRQK
jgi:cytidylate kinase